MKRWMTSLLAALVVSSAVVCAATDAAAQGGKSSRHWDPKTVESVSGEVTDVRRVPLPSGKAHGIHLVLETEATPALAVALGPDWWVDKQSLKIAKGDRVEVKGSRVTIDGQTVLVAAEVKKGDQTLVLRNADGVPAWSGASKRGRRAATPG